jgi:response regulator RpfG family c-di-GMP phosphodiesterase
LKKRDHLIKACFLTALSDLQEFDAFKKLFPDEGKRHFIQKPIENEEILERIENGIIAGSNYH